ncbi:prepilin-type N-terminal cleavage/methylation domain-containing protein [Candidatus Ozemobacteraceae bacterium]|nr:prepilin-type N-terminal cleavage/methylation domain-containing protein [Candidatus Ozemobacteraceae bacterium]
MKRRIGFTLIELMIVIAIIGISCESFFVPLHGLIRDIRSNWSDIQAQETLTTGFVLLEKAFATSTGLVVNGDDEISLAGGPCTSIRRIDDGRTLVITKQGAEMRIDFARGIVFGPFRPVDGRTVWSLAQMSEGRFPMFWRCRK